MFWRIGFVLVVIGLTVSNLPQGTCAENRTEVIPGPKIPTQATPIYDFSGSWLSNDQKSQFVIEQRFYKPKEAINWEKLDLAVKLPNGNDTNHTLRSSKIPNIGKAMADYGDPDYDQLWFWHPSSKNLSFTLSANSGVSFEVDTDSHPERLKVRALNDGELYEFEGSRESVQEEKAPKAGSSIREDALLLLVSAADSAADNSSNNAPENPLGGESEDDQKSDAPIENTRKKGKKRKLKAGKPTTNRTSKNLVCREKKCTRRKHSFPSQYMFDIHKLFVHKRLSFVYPNCKQDITSTQLGNLKRKHKKCCGEIHSNDTRILCNKCRTTFSGGIDEMRVHSKKCWPGVVDDGVNEDDEIFADLLSASEDDSVTMGEDLTSSHDSNTSTDSNSSAASSCSMDPSRAHSPLSSHAVDTVDTLQEKL